MELIILLIVIYFVWRHFKKKKARQNENHRASGQPHVRSASSAAPSGTDTNRSAGTDSDLSPEFKQKFKGCPLYTPQRFTGENRRITTIVEDEISKKEKKQFADRFGTDTPQYAFACAKSYYDRYLAKYHDKNLNIGISSAKGITLWLDTAVALARYYQIGFGCERDPQAALNLMLPVETFCSEQTKSVSASIQKDEDVNDTFVKMADVWLSLAECYACIGKKKESEKYYRMSLAMAKVHHEGVWGDGYFAMKVLNSAIGGFPVPANADLAGELALKLIQQNKVQGAYALREYYTLREMDYQEIGQSYQDDFAIYLKEGRKNGSGYAAYKLGECYLYGKGTGQNVEMGLSLLYEASNAKNLNAAMAISLYLEDFNPYSYRDEHGKKISSSASSAFYDVREMWEERVDHMAEDTAELAFFQKVIDGCAGAEDVIGPRLKPAAFQMDEDAAEKAGDSVREDASAGFFAFPYLLTDDLGRQWILDHETAEEARYVLNKSFDQPAQLDVADSLVDGTAYLKRADMAGGRAVYRGRTFRW